MDKTVFFSTERTQGCARFQDFVFKPCNRRANSTQPCRTLTFEFFTIGLSGTFEKVTQNKINFVKNCPQWGLNSQPPDHQSNALRAELSHYLVVSVKH